LSAGGQEASLALQALFGGLLVLPSLALAPFGFALARRITAGEDEPVARWRGVHVALVVAVYLALSIAVAAALGLAGAGEPGALGGIVLAAALDLGAAAAIAAVANGVDPAGWRALGFAPDRNARAASVGLIAYGIAFPGLFGLMLAWAAALQAVGVEVEPQPVLVEAIELRGVELALFSVYAIAVVPALEELLFRAFLQPFLVRRLGGMGGIALTSTIFAALHGASAFVPIFALSLVLGAVMLRTRRWSAVWVVHALHNGVMLALVFLVPGARERLLDEALLLGALLP
jgi:membrane protease YdiL (CAAX protease family)